MFVGWTWYANAELACSARGSLRVLGAIAAISVRARGMELSAALQMRRYPGSPVARASCTFACGPARIWGAGTCGACRCAALCRAGSAMPALAVGLRGLADALGNCKRSQINASRRQPPAACDPAAFAQARAQPHTPAQPHPHGGFLLNTRHHSSRCILQHVPLNTSLWLASAHDPACVALPCTARPPRRGPAHLLPSMPLLTICSTSSPTCTTPQQTLHSGARNTPHIQDFCAGNNKRVAAGRRGRHAPAC